MRSNSAGDVWVMNRLSFLMRLASAAAILLVARSAGADDKAEWLRSARSGAWSVAETWEGGKVPVAGAKVHVQTGHVVEYDVKSDAASPNKVRRDS